MITHSPIIEDTFKNGGGTYRADLRGPAELPDHGYMVGSCKIAALSLPVGSPNEITRTLDRASEACGLPNDYVGTWIDGDTLHIDVAQYVKTESRAVALCIARDELTYWDIQKGVAVNPRDTSV